MKQLTKAEEEIMQILWDLGEGNVATILEQMPEPKPAYNTVSTIVRILETKEFVGYKKQGRGHIYFPLVAKSDYSSASMSKMVNDYFNGSFKSMVSFFVKKKEMTAGELESILKEINKKDD
ncbi:BlaI/MecI/CopY family transcriptional regulator [Leeuwenhoekiella parthenopeia]|uniref:BlaI/MecI/CopY family transcriptional regulator n=1 Tax=Leeuwenhoekiella parthenopeia TaxID=2890320 RepID=A0ABS8GW99_9FLAO|nr:BlaI/MecI/CopY family transcriptional regulator [Leeuwenhoekiella parthenopeia]MCC4213472.1 BlaI/MecI/CopY family transcriptional regulator [Leeuwenhoekiella parthenopeia]